MVCQMVACRTNDPARVRIASPTVLHYSLNAVLTGSCNPSCMQVQCRKVPYHPAQWSPCRPCRTCLSDFVVGFVTWQLRLCASL